MAWEATWQTGGTHRPGETAAPMDQRTVENLLRRLVERLAVTALALLDPLNQAAKQALNRALVHGSVG